jgi:hypothetical protein
MDATAIINIALPLAQFALKAIEAANAGNREDAEKALAKMRAVYQKGSDDLDAALRALAG